MNIFPNIYDLDCTQSSSSAHARNPTHQNDEEQVQETDDDAEDIIAGPKPAIARRIYLFYELFKMYENLNKALVAIEEDFIQDSSWAKLTNSSFDGMTIRNYYCSTAGKLVCPVRLKIRPESASMEVSILISDNEHDHPEPKAGLSSQTKDLISEIYFYEKTTRPLSIQKRLFEKKIAVLPKVTQIKSFIRILKSKEIQNIATLGELHTWCKDNENLPNDGSRMFCPLHQIEREGKEIISIRLFLTTYDLISQVTEDVELLATDSTYKLVWNGYKVLLVGSCDREKKFHPFGIALTMSEKNQDFEFLFQALKDSVKTLLNREISPTVILADGADAIHIGFSKVFDLKQRIMCWAHVKRNVHTRYSRNKHYQQIKHDIDSLQLAITETMFENASQLFILKWTEIDPEFAAYFDKTWIKSAVNGWFDGRAHGHPVTNNALESHNKIIKDLVERKTLKLADFLDNFDKNVFSTWCFQRQKNRPDQKLFSIEPNVTLEYYKRACAWEMLGLKVVKQKFAGKNFFFVERSAYQAPTYPDAPVPAASQAPTTSNAPTASQLEKRKPGRPKKRPQIDENIVQNIEQNSTVLNIVRCKNYLQMINKCEWNNFDNYRETFQDLRIIQLNHDNWKLSTCTCPSWFKHYMCKHIIGISYRENLIGEFPKEALTHNLGQVASAGRPKKMTKALSK